jgi:cell division septum initiation protein DivIVA
MIREDYTDIIQVENASLKEENLKLKQKISELKQFIASQIQSS